MINKVCIVFGGGGFIGSTLVDRLMSLNVNIVVVDNLINGCLSYLEPFFSSDRFHFLNKDCSVAKDCLDIFLYASRLGEIVDLWHLAANSDIQSGNFDPSIDLNNTFLTTYEIINCIKIFPIKNFYFASSSAIYGDHGNLSIQETTGPLLPISNYGAMKLASEGFISASAERLGFSALLFRFPNVIGSPATHGVIFDFVKKLLIDKSILYVLGNGLQKKTYLHVSDLVDAMLYMASISKDNRVLPINIGPLDKGVTVKYIAEKVVEKFSPRAKIVYGKEARGWIGDVPEFNYNINLILNMGWLPKYSSSEAVEISIEEIIMQLEK